MSCLTDDLLRARVDEELGAAELELPEEPTLSIPEVGAHQLRILTPTLLEITLITCRSAARGR